ncbi:MAG: hypothetical protein A3K77_06285 [Euryarchaeota archaeon RBG_13_31_8]|nr:MAG: hypothetical protein A3K77_06285 [Euryarchaeota archaeon RBG_13_31_8]
MEDLKKIIQDDKKESEKTEKKKPSRIRKPVEKKEEKPKKVIDQFYYKTLLFKKETLENMEMSKIFILTVLDFEFKVEIKYNMDRGRFQVWLTHDNRRQSLSFFQQYKNAWENTLDNICYRVGGIENSMKNSGMGD